MLNHNSVYFPCQNKSRSCPIKFQFPGLYIAGGNVVYLVKLARTSFVIKVFRRIDENCDFSLQGEKNFYMAWNWKRSVQIKTIFWKNNTQADVFGYIDFWKRSLVKENKNCFVKYIFCIIILLVLYQKMLFSKHQLICLISLGRFV